MSEQIIIKKKKVQGGHGHHGGSWKVAYADFVTAMMAFFMVMWIMGLSDDTRTQIQGYFNDPMGFNKTLPRSKAVITIRGVPATKPGTAHEPDQNGTNQYEADQDQLNLKQVESEIRRTIAKDPNLRELLSQVEIEMTREGLRVEFVESGHVAFFESGSAVLRPEAQKMVREIAPILRKFDRPMMVEGHTDAVPYPSEVYTNWDLSSDRAQALRLALSQGGVKLDQFRAVRGLADSQLRDRANPRSARNRRVSILLPWDTRTKPMETSSKVLPKPPSIRPLYDKPDVLFAGAGPDGEKKSSGGHGGGH